jgi:flagellar biosynthesis protein FliR
VEIENIQGLFATYILIMTRLTGAFILSPVVGTKLIPVRIKLTLTLLCTYIASLSVPVVSGDLWGASLILLLSKEFVLGALFGLIFNLVFTVFTIAGEIIGMQSGLSMAQMNDPVSNTSLPIISQIFLMFLGVLFISMDGLQLIIQVVIQSFDIFKIDEMIPLRGMAKEVTLLGSWVFSSALRIALPAVVSLLTVNFTFAIMTRAAPQMNIFSIGFPFTMVCGLGVTGMMIPIIASHFQANMFESFTFLKMVVFKENV